MAVYSNDADFRARVIELVGPRPSTDLPGIEYLEVATEPALLMALDKGGIDVVILDGESVPAGGMGVGRQIKDEIRDCPPVVLIVARHADAWLATWSRADVVAPIPLDPLEFPDSVAGLLRDRIAALGV